MAFLQFLPNFFATFNDYFKVEGAEVQQMWKKFGKKIRKPLFNLPFKAIFRLIPDFWVPKSVNG